MAKDLERQLPLQMLETWGLRIRGSSLKDPNEAASGESITVDDELALCMYVESTDGFFYSRPVLRHVFVEFLPIASYRYVGPGETAWQASLRHGQVELYARLTTLEKLKDREAVARLAQALHDSFLKALTAKTVLTPFRVPDRQPEARVPTCPCGLTAYNRNQCTKGHRCSLFAEEIEPQRRVS
jgi:hypothetical protein